MITTFFNQKIASVEIAIRSGACEELVEFIFIYVIAAMDEKQTILFHERFHAYF